MKLALGTVQFGMDYGISNEAGEVKLPEIEKILNYAHSQGISILDTAAAYGTSERKLGQTKSITQFDVITKLSNISKSISIINQVEESLQRLRVKALEAVLFHQANDMINSPLSCNWFNELQHLKQEGKIKKLGVSVYTIDQLAAIIEKFDIDIVQLPFNCLDQRFSKSGWLEQLKNSDIEIHCRSIFLQGLLLQDHRQLNNYFNRYTEILNRFWTIASQYGLSKLELALSIACENPYIDKIIVGCCNLNQLKEIVDAYQKAETVSLNLTQLATTDEMLIIPSNRNTGS